MQYCAGRQSRDHASYLIYKNHMDIKNRMIRPSTGRTMRVRSMRRPHHNCAGLAHRKSRSARRICFIVATGADAKTLEV
jgi:3-phenylpropionate/cinnamic acid dioxygenase small subunit